MFQASLYTRNRVIQQRDIDDVLHNSLELMRIDSNDQDVVVADLGCATGDVIEGKLLPRIPNAKCVYGLDVSKEMIEFANSNNTNEKIKYRVVDLGHPDGITEELTEKVDYAFSFHVFMWIMNQKQLFKNIYKMLKPGGELLGHFVTKSDIKNVHDKLVLLDKWKSYIRPEDDILPYQYCKNPQKEIEKHLNDNGFAHIVKIQRRTYYFNSISEFRNSMKVINPFIKRVPEELREEFMDDVMEIAKNLGIFFIDHEELGNIISFSYDMATVFLRKPKSINNPTNKA